MAARHCRVCNVEHDEDEALHNNTDVHRFNFLLYQWNEYKKPLVKDRHGIEVLIEPKQVNGFLYNYTIDRNRGKHNLKVTPNDVIAHDNELNFLCTIKNSRRDSSVILTSALLLHPYKLYSLVDPQGNIGVNYVQLQAGAKYTVIVRFSTENVTVGSYKIPVSFNFQTVGDNVDTFTIARAIVVSIEEASPEEVATASPFTNNEWPPNIEVYPPTQNQKHICKYPIPGDIYPFLRMGLRDHQGMSAGSYDQLMAFRRQLDPGFVTLDNFRMFWHIMLWLEEVGQILMLRRYNMENVKMTLMDGNRLELEVPGLAEKRPSVISGDMVDIRVHEDHRAYRGVIRAVNDKTVWIDYVDDELIAFIEVNPGIELDVRFQLNRLPLERMHQGVDQAVLKGIVPSLFPSNSLRNFNPTSRTLRDTEFFNDKIPQNAEQRTAVLNILNNTSKNVPYIVFGPPGTGKTVTIVEAILQIKKKTKNKILVCAPANAACDMLTEKLMMHCTKKELIRIMSENVDKQSLHPLTLEYSNFVDGVFMKPTVEEISQYRIVVTTLILIGRYSQKYKPDVVFIDEAAQPVEPEACCALGMLEKGKQMVLAGDPKQLGPSVSSKVSEGYGLGKSLLERLMDLELYKSSDTNFITMLKLNFRSHSTILQLPNQLFYENQLTAVSTKSENDPIAKVFVFKHIEGLAGKKKKNKNQLPGQAIEFCSIISQESRQGRSPSYFNNKEMQMVLKYVRALTNLTFDDEEDKVLPEQIGVVTPYIRQVYKIRTILSTNNFEGVEVGTTETFQGREKRIIIISTVRAKHDLLAFDKKYNLGFVRNEKRFNVALTRAMSKLIVIGCAHVLGTDDKWLQYITQCEEIHAFCGTPYARRTQEVRDDIVGRLGRIQMLDTQHNH